MIDRYVVDFDKTFGGAMLLGVEPKMSRVNRDDRNSPMEQSKDKDGVLRWTVTLAVAVKSFDNTKYENIPVTITSPNKPYGAIQPGSFVIVEGLEMGIMVQTRGGFSVFYSAENIRPAHPAQQPARQASQ